MPGCKESVMGAPYSKTFLVGWGDLDANGHMANTAYWDYAATTRFSFFAEQGFPAPKFRELQIGPVVLKEEVEFFKEVLFLQELTVTFFIEHISDDGAKMKIANEMFNAKGEKVAILRTYGAWLDLKTRKISPPPSELLEIMKKLIPS